MSDRIAVMNDGIIGHLGSPREIYEHPRTRFVAGFTGTSNLLTGTVAGVEGGRAVIGVNAEEWATAPLHGASVAAGGELELTARPEKIELGATAHAVPAVGCAAPSPRLSTSAPPPPSRSHHDRCRHDHFLAELGVRRSCGRARRQRLAVVASPHSYPVLADRIQEDGQQ